MSKFFNKVKLIISLLIVGIAMTGLSQFFGSSAIAKGTTLTVWYWGEQEAPGLEKWMNDTAKLYMQKNPNIKVNTVLQTTNGLYPAFRAAAKAKKGPDIQYLWGGVLTLEDVWTGNVAPTGDYFSKEELSHIVNTFETTYAGKIWGLSWYIVPIGVMPYNKKIFLQTGLDPEEPPSTWDDFLKVCAKIKARGITPIGLGIKDGWVGGWLFSLLGGQSLDNEKEIMRAVVGDVSFTDPKYASWWKKLDELIKAGYFNPDVTSLELYQGQDLFASGEVAMTITVSSGAVAFLKTLGKDKVGVMTIPAFGKGKMAGRCGAIAQQLVITSFSPNKEEAADFLRFMHTPERLNAIYRDSGAFPADDRFDANLLKTSQERKMFSWIKEKSMPWGENFIPSQLNEEGNFRGCQLLFAGEITPEEAAQRVENIIEKWRKTNPQDVENFRKWMKE